MDRRECAPATKRIEYAHIHALFEWARKQMRNLLIQCQLTAVDKPKIDHKEPKSLTIDQAKNLFRIANEVEDGSLVAYFVLAIFAALRPFEVRRAQWEDFDWDENITNPCSPAKGRWFYPCRKNLRSPSNGSSISMPRKRPVLYTSCKISPRLKQ